MFQWVDRGSGAYEHLLGEFLKRAASTPGIPQVLTKCTFFSFP